MKRMILVGIWLFLLYTVWILNADFNLFPNKDSDTYADRLANQAFFEEMSKPSKLGYVPNLDFAFISVDHLMYNIESSLYMVERLSDFQEAEKLYVAACGDYQDRFNSIPAIRPFLGEFPLTPNELAPSLSFRDVDGQRIPPPDIASVYLRHGVLAFTHVKSRSLEKIYEKPVQSVEGLRELYQRGISRHKEGPKPHIPTYHYLWKGGDICDELFIFGREFAQRNRLEPVCCILKKEKEENRPFQFGFRGTQQLSLSMARTLIGTCAKDFFSFIQKNKTLVNYLKERKTWINEKYFGDFPEKDHVALRISFWDEYVNRVAEPYIAEIRVAGESFKYYTANERQFLVLAYEETWDEAMEFLEQETKSQERERAPQQSEVK